MSDDELAQPDVEDERWTIDEQRHFVGMNCTIERDSEEVGGEVAAIWSFPGQARARRRPARGRRTVQHGQRAGQFRRFVTPNAMKLYNPPLGTSRASRTSTAQSTTAEESAPGRASTSQVFARAGVRTGFFCGRRLKRLAFSSGYAFRRGVLGRRASRDTTSMPYTQENSQQESSRLTLQRNQSGSTLRAVERIVEESPRRYGAVREQQPNRDLIARRDGDGSGITTSKFAKVSSTPPYYRYHTSDTTHNTPHATATSHVVAPASRVESRGGRR